MGESWGGYRVDLCGDRPFKRAWLGGVLGDLRVVFIQGRINTIGGKISSAP